MVDERFGEKYNHLTIGEYSHTSKNGRKYYFVHCDCGNTKIMAYSKVAGGYSTTCGCRIGRKRKHHAVEVGMEFGKLKVIGDSGNKEVTCKCACGNIITVDRNRLTRKTSPKRDCGKCIKHECKPRYEDLTGKVFGRLKVISHSHNKGKTHYWNCLCECGNTHIASSKSLKSNKVKSCGCLQVENGKKQGIASRGRIVDKHSKLDLSGNTYNFLEVLEYKDKGDWLCRCTLCGNTTLADGHDIVTGKKKSCGCWKGRRSASRPENFIAEFIGLPVERGKRILGGKEIDIYIPSLNVGIEYNGSAYHATKGAVFSNKDKYYHRDKFLLAKEKSINLITIFDIDFDNLIFILRDLLENKPQFLPQNDIEYTNNSLGSGGWMKNFGYEEIGQEEPQSFEYRGFVVYDCGRTIWSKIID